MKKLMILAVAAVALVACSKEFDTNKSASNGTAIGFNTWAEQLTKARVQGSNTFTEGDNFSVFGSKITNSTPATVFNDITVTRGSTDVWTYSPTRYWDQSADSYVFYAVSPAGIADLDPADGSVAASESITFGGNDNDVLVADKAEVAKANFGTKVTMQFNHVASLVDFKVKKHSDLGTDVLAITSFSITNIDNTGTFAVSNAYTSTHPVVTWTATAHAGTYDRTAGVTSVTLPTDVSNSTPDFLINNLVAMPQTFRTDANIQTVNIEYTIKDNAGSGTTSTFSDSFNLKLFDDVDDKDNEDTIIGGWVAGKHYTFIITINANKIEFGASITDWTTETGYNYLVN